MRSINNIKSNKYIYKYKLIKNIIKTDMSREAMRYVDLFNTFCKNLGDKLQEKMPKNNNIIFVNKAFETLIQTKREEPISIFVDKIYDNDSYRNKLLEGDANFFLENDVSNLASMSLIDQIKNIWTDLDSSTQCIVMKYLQSMTKACCKYVDEMAEHAKSHRCD